MKIGAFLDFDGVLTTKAVNMQFASMLGIEKQLVDLEIKYANGLINNKQFNETFIPLFRNAGFTKSFLETNISAIQLHPFAADVVQELRGHTYLVTSSPSYVIDPFCQRYHIPSENYICSEYEFDSDELLSRCIRPCGTLQKEEFVRVRSDKYDLRVGVGDSVELDGPFLKFCDIGILMQQERRDQVTANDLYSIWRMLSQLRGRSDAFIAAAGTPSECRDGVRSLVQRTTYERNVFIMTPFRMDVRYSQSISAIKSELQTYGYSGYTAIDHTLVAGRDLWTNVRAFMHGCKYGVALLTAYEAEKDLAVHIDPDKLNPNVVAEIGYMMGLGKQVLVLKDHRVQLPTDWVGQIYEPFDMKDPEQQIRDAVRLWSSTI